MTAETKTHNDYGVGWICALSKEQTVATAMLDERHEDLPKPAHDSNTYTLGSISGHNVVIACLPKGRYGTNSAANVATLMIRTFPSLKVCLMVGIGGGVPTKVRLGDVVVSTPDGQHPGVIQWDMGKAKDWEFERTGALNNPPNSLLSALNKLETEHKLAGSKISEYLAQVTQRYPRVAKRYLRPHALKDMLFESDCIHIHDPKVDEEEESDEDESEAIQRDGCRLCDKTAIIERKPRPMRIHYGLIASGNQVVKNGILRDMLNQDLGGQVLCFEMEAAGLMNNFPCLVIRGICDYSDAHKSNVWQEHAAAVAAAFAKELLYHVQLSDIKGERAAAAILNKVEQEIQHMHQMVKDGFGEAQKDLNNLLDENEIKKQNEVLRWLSPIDFAVQHYDFITQCEPGTGQSLFTSTEFVRWMEEKNTTLFCPGIPGSGKTLQMSILVSYLLHKFQDDQTASVVYLYFDYKQQQQKTEYLLANMVKQICQKLMRGGLPTQVQELYEQHEKTSTRPLIKELSKVLISLIKLFSRVFIIIDALDECEDHDGNRTRLLDQLFSLQKETHLNLFATSRAIPSITARFPKCIQREIIPDHGDVMIVLDNHMSQLPGFVVDDVDLQNEIKTSIETSIDGIFLLARLYIDSLVGKRSPAALRLALKKLRDNCGNGLIPLYNAYDEALYRIQHQKGDLPHDALLILSWIVKARKKLTPQELQEALAVQAATLVLDMDNIPTIDHITQACAPLVVFDKESNIIRLAHYTLQEYFEQPNNTILREAHVKITKSCMAYLSFSAFQSGPIVPQDKDDWRGEKSIENNFYNYAARYWGYHTREALTQGLDPLEVVCFLERVKEDSWYTLLLQRHLIDLFDIPIIHFLRAFNAEDLTPLHLASCFGLYDVVNLLIAKGYDPNAEDSTLRTPLWYAARNGHAPVVRRLLELDTNLETKDDMNYQTPLSAAARRGHELVVQLLLDKDADLESQGGVELSPARLMLKAGLNRVKRAFTKSSGEPFNPEDLLNLTPLAWAVIYGHEATVKVLVERGANIETKDHKGLTPLAWAIRKGHAGIIELLLANNVDIMTKDNDGMTQFLYADEAILEILFAKPANLEVKDESGKTPLAWAAATGSTMLAKFLLTRDVDIEARDDDGLTPLTAGVISGDTAIPEMLLARKAHLDPRDKDNRTPLLWAAYAGYGPMMKLLLSKNADIEAQDGGEATPLACAVLLNNFETAKILVDNKANVNYHRRNGMTILHMAALKASQDIISLLLESEIIDIEPMDENGRSPLSYAASSGNYDATKALLDTGRVDIGSKDKFSRTPIWYAKNEAEDDGLIQLLLNYGAEVDDDELMNDSLVDEHFKRRCPSSDNDESPPYKRRC